MCTLDSSHCRQPGGCCSCSRTSTPACSSRYKIPWLCRVYKMCKSYLSITGLAVQSLLAARWPLELQQNKHSCIKQLQDVYLSLNSFGNVVGSADLRRIIPDETDFLDLTAVSVGLPMIFCHWSAALCSPPPACFADLHCARSASSDLHSHATLHSSARL